MCFRPVKAEKFEPTLVIEKLEAVTDSSKKFKVDAKNTSSVVDNLLPRVFVRESSSFDDVEVPVVWGQNTIESNAVSNGVAEFNWMSGKGYYVKASTSEGTSATLFTKTP